MAIAFLNIGRGGTTEQCDVPEHWYWVCVRKMGLGQPNILVSLIETFLVNSKTSPSWIEFSPWEVYSVRGDYLPYEWTYKKTTKWLTIAYEKFDRNDRGALCLATPRKLSWTTWEEDICSARHLPWLLRRNEIPSSQSYRLGEATWFLPSWVKMWWGTKGRSN